MIEALLGECVGPLGRLGLEPAGALCMQELSDKGHTSPGQLVGQLGCCFRGGGGGAGGAPSISTGTRPPPEWPAWGQLPEGF